MNERDFGQHILELFKKNKDVKRWYEDNLENEDFSITIDRIALGLCERGGLSVKDAILLSLFIGLSTDPRPTRELETKQE